MPFAVAVGQEFRMKFAITVELSEDLADKSVLIYDLSANLEKFFSDRDYGNDLKEVMIGLIAVAPQFEWFSTVRKSKYTFNRRHTINEVEIVEDRIFSFYFKIDYEDFKNQSNDQSNKMLSRELLKSLINLDSLPKKVKDFDKERFRKDMKDFFKESA